MESFEEEINHLEIVWILLEARNLNSFNNSLGESCKYIFSYILDDKLLVPQYFEYLIQYIPLHLIF